MGEADAMNAFTGRISEADMSNEVGNVRGAPRFTSLIRAAKLVCGQGEFICVVRDVSATGVSLRTFHRLPTDHTVALELQNGASYEMRQVRKSGYDASYAFHRPIAVEHLVQENWEYPKRQLRLHLAVPLTLTALAGRFECVTLNLSQQGARIDCRQLLAIDQTVRVESPVFSETRCKVRWRKNGQYGLVFDNTFSLREFALLAAQVQCPSLLQDEPD